MIAPDLTTKCTVSAQAALRWASLRANMRADKKRSATLTAVDLLIGILMSHPNSSEPEALLSHFAVPLEPLYSLLHKDGGFTLDDAPKPPGNLVNMPPLSAEAEKILDLAGSLAREHNPEPDKLIRLRDLFGAILMMGNSAQDMLQQIAADYHIPLDDIISSYPDYLKSPAGKIEFKGFLDLKFPPGPIAQSSAPPECRIPGYSSDTCGTTDRVGIGAEIDAFAYLMAARTLNPPLAIGLFGDWGSGKSFFMEALQRRIEKITADARDSNKPQKEVLIYKHVAQIEFNAWHYMEGELWASLVEHIFQNLKTHHSDSRSLLQQRQKAYFQKLENKRSECQLAEECQKKLQNELEQIRARIDTLKQNQKNKLKELQQIKLKDLLTSCAFDDRFKEQISEMAQKLGITVALDNYDNIKKSVIELQAALVQAGGLLAPLRVRGWKWAAALVFIIFLGPAAAFLFHHLQGADRSAIVTAAAGISTFLSGMTLFIKKGTSWVAAAAGRIETARDVMERRERDADAFFAQEIAAEEQKLQDQTAELERARMELEKKQLDLEQLNSLADTVLAQRVMQDFIAERTSSKDYQKHLGLAAIIRSDFEQLSELIAAENRELLETEDGSEPEKNLHQINRIVLYIDDLDRCPPERVVQVLQAVHLLLAFPLFIVVVAVDARWLAQSLEKHYDQLLAPSASHGGLTISDGFDSQATPQDYLEKIFQVPFWIRPLSEKARLRIVSHLLEPSMVLALGSADSANPHDPTREEQLWQDDGQRRPLDNNLKTEYNPQGLQITASEYDFMKLLKSLLGETPRSVKRFVNTYRLIKAIALEKNPQFLNEDKFPADYQCVLLLLVILTGLPAISREFFQRLQIIKEITSAADSGNGKKPAAPTLRDVVEQLRKTLAACPSEPPAPAPPKTLPKRGTKGQPQSAVSVLPVEETPAARELDALEDWLDRTENHDWLDLPVTIFDKWVPEVVRFSYRKEEI